jgi:hypothetical protein
MSPDWHAIEAVATGLAALISATALYLTAKLHEEVQKSGRRKLLVPLWTYISDADELDPGDPIFEHMRRVSNTLELVAVCVEGKMVDGDVVRRVFELQFIKLYQQLEQCPKPVGDPRFVSGKDLLSRSPATRLLYFELTDPKKGQLSSRGAA